MKIASITKICAATALAVTMAGCSSWDSMSHRQKSTVGGAALGGVAGDHQRRHPRHGRRRASAA